MKGILSKYEGRWGVVYDIPNPPIATATVEWLPLHPEYEKHYFQDEDAEGGEVEWDWCVIVDHDSGKSTQYAKLKRPEEQTNGERFEEFMNSLDKYPELEGTNALCEDIIKKRTGKMTEEEWLAAEKAQAKEEQKGILVELMELDSKDGLYHASSQTEISEHPKTIIDEIDAILFQLEFGDRMRVFELFDKYINESYPSEQTEISDEEIGQEFKHYSDNWEIRQALEEGAKWYREQLKKKQ